MSEQIASVTDMQQALNKHLAREPNKVKALHQLTYVAHFNFLRLGYEQFSFADKKRLYQMYMELFPEDGLGDLFDGKFVLDCLEYIMGKKGHFLRIHELGGYQGELAWKVLSKHPRMTWSSYDIIEHKTLPELADNFSETVLDKELWESNIGILGDVFVSMHTLEHFSNEEFTQLISYIIKQKIPYLILQIPLEPEGQSWKNYLGAHVLTYGSLKVKAMLAPYYVLEREVAKGRKVREGWCSFWRLRCE